MPVTPTYPGVYVQEKPSGVRTIVGVATSIGLFIGRTKKGPMRKPIRIQNYTNFVRIFSDDTSQGDLPRHVRLFFLNGGTDCYVMRVAAGSAPAKVTLLNAAGPANVLELTAKDDGLLGNLIRVGVTYDGATPESTFSMEIFRWDVDPTTGRRDKADREVFNDLSMDPTSPRFAPSYLTVRSKLVNAALPAALVPAPAGFSLSGRAITFDPANAGTDDATFKAALTPLIGTGSATNAFRLTVERNLPVTVDLSGINVAALGAGVAAAVAGLIKQAIENALTAAGILGYTANVTWVAGPSGINMGPPPTALAGSNTRLLRVQMQKGAIVGVDVRIESAPAQDAAAVLMLGTANGGVEVGAFAALRPAPTGISLRADVPGTIVGLMNTAQNAVNTITLDSRNNAGVVAPENIPVVLTDVPAGPFMYTDPTTSVRGLVAKLQRLRDAVTTAAPVPPPPRSVPWTAAVVGNRLTISAKEGEDDNRLLAGFATAPTNLAASFTVNVRYYSLGPGGLGAFQGAAASGSDGTAPTAADYTAAYIVVDREVDLFNLMVIPPDRNPAPLATPPELYGEASVFCQQRRAFLVMDPPDAWVDFQTATTGIAALRIGLVKDYSAVYFPRIRIAEQGTELTMGPAGAMAGLYARIDGSRGVWKAPAGTEADLRGVIGLDLGLSDAENGAINPLGINAIRIFPDGIVSWGARTVAGADMFASEYKYVPIRRVALFIEESLYRGLKWVVFEPNDEPLWAQIRLNVGAFMHNLFRQGAFQGVKPTDAYFVKCDSETTTQNDQNLGIVNIVVGFAPLKPAEFVVIQLQQMAGQIQA
jgi:phage tail sheath protein FI